MPHTPQGLFHQNASNLPLAERVRPHSLKEMSPPPGLSEHHLHTWKAAQGVPPNLILWGPPGSGKTTLARALGNTYQATFHELSAVNVGVKDVREIVSKAHNATSPTLLFLDEVHRFNKAQQDILLPWIEQGTLSFIGATTENPTFSLNAALLSRCEVVHLTGFEKSDLESVLCRALELEEQSLNTEQSEHLIRAAQGDARTLLRLTEAYLKTRRENEELSIEEFLRNSTHLHYDREGDEHYNSISAFIKSMRSGNTDAALYYGLRMIEAGEDPRYLLRRMIIFASEDIGNAQPQALMIANQASEAYERVGLPEGKIPIAQAICFLATAPKSRASYNALRAAEKLVQSHPNLPVPLSLRNTTPAGMSTAEEESLQDLPKPLQHAKLYEPTESGYEQKLKKS
jgi:putative ATPase